MNRICKKCKQVYEDMKIGDYGEPYLCDKCKKTERYKKFNKEFK